MNNLFVIFLLAVFLSTCRADLPYESDVPTHSALPIDGVWEIEDIVGSNAYKSVDRYKLSNGNIILEKKSFGGTMRTGMVCAIDIRPISKNTYEGTFFSATITPEMCTCTVRMRVVKNKIFCKKTYKTCGGVSRPDKFILTNPILKNPDWYYSSHRSNKVLSRFSLSNLSEKRLQREVQTQTVADGSVVTIERSRTIRHQLNFHASNSKGESTTKGTYISPLDLLTIEKQKSIKNEIERSIGRIIEDEESYKVTVTLDGNMSNKWNLIWYDKVKTGTIEYLDETGKKKYIYFELPISSELEVVKVK